jgi:hypothetical protein
MAVVEVRMSRATPTTLAELSILAQAQLHAEREVEEAQKVLKEKNATLLRVREESVPMAMRELELDKIKLHTGHEVSVKQDVYCSISEANADEAHGWLESHDFGGLIKTMVVVPFGKDEMPFALALLAQLRKMKVKAKVKRPQPPKIVKGKPVKQPPKLEEVTMALDPMLERGVHPQTLKAFLREQLSKTREEGDDIPLDLFGARPVWVSKITPPKP